jgi:hypothetical protein
MTTGLRVNPDGTAAMTSRSAVEGFREISQKPV